MKICIEYGDTNFIGLVNAEKYSAFVNGDWEFNELISKFNDEMRNGNILVMQMTNEGVEHSWEIAITREEKMNNEKYYRMATGSICVTSGCLYIVEYTCLTMAAQFEDEKIPDKNCERYKIQIENGIYNVEIYQYLNVDTDERIGRQDVDLIYNFSKVQEMKNSNSNVLWCSYC